MVKTTKGKPFQFGESFEQLNKIVEQLESGSADLDKALVLYEEGLKIVQDCKKHLTEVENKVKVIRESYAIDSESDEEDEASE